MEAVSSSETFISF